MGRGDADLLFLRLFSLIRFLDRDSRFCLSRSSMFFFFMSMLFELTSLVFFPTFKSEIQFDGLWQFFRHFYAQISRVVLARFGL